MNWITKALSFGEKIKRVLKKRPSKEDIANSDWTSCCKGPILKKELEENLWVCNSCGKHHRINCLQRFDIIFGRNAYEILDSRGVPTLLTEVILDNGIKGNSAVPSGVSITHIPSEFLEKPDGQSPPVPSF